MDDEMRELVIQQSSTNVFAPRRVKSRHAHAARERACSRSTRDRRRSTRWCGRPSPRSDPAASPRRCVAQPRIEPARSNRLPERLNVLPDRLKPLERPVIRRPARRRRATHRSERPLARPARSPATSHLSLLPCPPTPTKQNAAGKPQKGTIEAASSEEAIQRIKSQGFFPTSVREQKMKGDADAGKAGEVAKKKKKRLQPLDRRCRSRS
jgi:hypothetical protein